MDGTARTIRDQAAWQRRVYAVAASVQEHPYRWLTLCALLLATQINPWWFPTPDSCSYLSMGRSLALTGTLTNLGSPHWRYPPGYAVLISPLFLVGQRPFLLISLLHWALAVMWICGVYAWARRLSASGAIWIALVVAVNAMVWMHIRQALTELAFMTLLIWTVVLMATLFTARSWGSTAWRTTLAALMVACLVTVRQAGIVLVPGFAVALGIEAFQGRVSWRRAGGLSLAVAMPGVAVLLALVQHDVSRATVAGSDPYVAGFVHESHGVVGQTLEGLRLRISDVGRLTMPGMFKAYGPAGRWLEVNWIASFAAFAIVTWGWWRLIKGRGDALVWMWPFYFALHSAWAWDAGARYLVPVIPLLMAGVWFALGSLPRWRVHIVAVLLAGHALVSVGYWMTRSLPRSRALAVQWPIVDAISLTIANDPGPIVSEDLNDHVRLMLQLSTDRPVVPREKAHVLADDARWLVQPRGASLDDGFAVRRVAGGYQVAVRQAGPLLR